MTFILRPDLSILKIYLHTKKYYHAAVTSGNKVSTYLGVQKSEPFGFCDLDLDLVPDLVTLIYEVDLKILKMYLHTKNEHLSKFRALQTDTHTDMATRVQ